MMTDEKQTVYVTVTHGEDTTEFFIDTYAPARVVVKVRRALDGFDPDVVVDGRSNKEV